MVDVTNTSNYGQLVAEFNKSVLQDMSMMFADEEFVDVVFKIDGTFFPVHKCILAQRSHYFRALFTGNFTEKLQDVIELKEISVEDFELCLSIIYGTIPDSDFTDVDRASHILAVSVFFLIDDVVAIVMGFFQKSINSDNVLKIYEQALYYSFHDIARNCIEKLSHIAPEILEHEDMLSLSANTMKRIISLDSFYAPEIKIFHAVQKWLEVNPCVDSKQEILDLVRLGRISQDDMIKFVWRSNLYSSDRIIQSLAKSKYRPDQPGRGELLKNVDHCMDISPKINICNAWNSFLLDFQKFSYKFNKMLLMNVTLKDNYIINCLEFTVRNRDRGSPYRIKFHYSNIIIGYNEVEWIDAEVTQSLTIDYFKLIIPPTVVRYISILALQDTPGKIVRINDVRCFYKDEDTESIQMSC